MCTVIVLRRPGHAWPLLLGANRDELTGRRARPPGAHWRDRPDVIAGLDELGGGSWLGLNRDGLVAAVLNATGALGPADGKRSRGELVLEALDHAEATVAAEALGNLDATAWRPFHLLVADAMHAVCLTSDGQEVRAIPLGDGAAMLTASGLDDQRSPRVQRFSPLLAAAAPPDPAAGNWRNWQALLATGAEPGQGQETALCLRGQDGFGTVSSALMALPADILQAAVWLHAEGPPDANAYAPVALWPASGLGQLLAGRPAASMPSRRS